MAPDWQGWRQWLARHGPALVLYAGQWTRCAADAEDAVQDGFVRFWQARGAARGVGYLYACVRTAAIDLSRSGNRHRKRIDKNASVESAASLFCPGHEDLPATVEAALGRLPPDQREVVVMKIWGGLTFAQISQALRISPNTAASRYRYAVGRLEADLADEVTHD